MPFDDDSFDFVVCRAAFKNFSEPVAVLSEIHRVVKPGGKGLILDLRKDAPLEAIDEHVGGLGLNPVNAFLTRSLFRHMLLRRAYTRAEFERFAAATRFGHCELRDDTIAFQAWLTKVGAQRGARTASA